jgi:hypothetical protein
VAMQPAGANTTERLKWGDQMYFMTETGMMFTHRYGSGCSLTHATTSITSVDDSAFGSPTYYPFSDGQ